LLTTLVAGDGRLLERFRSDELLPVGSRIRARLTLERATPIELLDLLQHAVTRAGNPKLMTRELMTTLAEHGAGNPRSMMNMAAELLAAGAHREVKQLDEKLYFEVFAPSAPTDGGKGSAPARRR
jgi:type II secretory pathway predicted ATPase ExeA